MLHAISLGLRQTSQFNWDGRCDMTLTPGQGNILLALMLDGQANSCTAVLPDVPGNTTRQQLRNCFFSLKSTQQNQGIWLTKYTHTHIHMHPLTYTPVFRKQEREFFKGPTSSYCITSQILRICLPGTFDEQNTRNWWWKGLYLRKITTVPPFLCSFFKFLFLPFFLYSSHDH